MRAIDTFYVTKTRNDYPAIIREAREIGFLYPAPHVFITRLDFNDPESKYFAMRLRPLSHRCATVRDSRINNNGVGIVIQSLDDHILESALLIAASEIKNIIEDLGIVNYNIVTDEIDKERRVETMTLESKVSIVPSKFTRLK